MVTDLVDQHVADNVVHRLGLGLCHIRVRPVIACRVLGMPSAFAVFKLDVFGLARQLLLGCSTMSGCLGGGFGGKSLRVGVSQPVSPAPVMFDHFVMRFRHERLAFGLWLRSAIAPSRGDRAAI